MARYPQSWLCSSRQWLGYLYTLLAGALASIFGWWLLSVGISRVWAALISISVAVVVGFVAEAIHYFLAGDRKQELAQLVVIVSTPATEALSGTRPSQVINNAQIRLA